MSDVQKTVPSGVYAPLYTFFHEDESLDLESFKHHVKWVASAGVGIVALGSSGEAVHLSHDERREVLLAARQVLDSDASLAAIPLIAGTPASSTRETIELTRQAAECGADSAMVITPGYFAGTLTRAAIKQFFTDVAEASPIPILVYNYPGASAGIDIDSELMSEIAQNSSNIVGCKLTCGSVGKLSRLTWLDNFAVLGGFADFMSAGLLLDGAGCITGLANLAPKTCMQLYKATTDYLKSPSAEALDEVRRLQGIVSRADWPVIKGGIAGPKYVLDRIRGYGGAPRRPLLPMEAKDGEKMLAALQEILEHEKTL
ncbi:putative dihydrodipicolinate synthase [Rhodotorula sp. JG-1b]|nr:putative dihydrodipicolinate synthase [Rhodotorula sp. JG-1b]